MPLPASPYNAVPNGIQRPVTPPGAGPGLAPPGGTEPMPSPEAQAAAQAAAQPGGELDLFQKVAMLMIDPQTRQINPMIAMFFAGMGAREALEKSGKFVSKPHRSNQELSQQGYDTGIPGQTGLPSPQQMQAQTMPPTVGGPPAPMGG